MRPSRRHRQTRQRGPRRQSCGAMGSRRYGATVWGGRSSPWGVWGFMASPPQAWLCERGSRTWDGAGCGGAACGRAGGSGVNDERPAANDSWALREARCQKRPPGLETKSPVRRQIVRLPTDAAAVWTTLGRPRIAVRHRSSRGAPQGRSEREGTHVTRVHSAPLPSTSQGLTVAPSTPPHLAPPTLSPTESGPWCSSTIYTEGKERQSWKDLPHRPIVADIGYGSAIRTADFV